ncbi:MAG: amino acid permease [Acidimicrobiia bacterium]|nr:amino acid permease [Acidimicrobiia bacterium]NNL12678.1 amino acid permease [Acidimicrobiia bacterium]
MSSRIDPNGRTGTLGTFAGVFVPSILTILGIILFLRLGYVVGNGGLWQTLMIIGIATAVSVLTSISLAAIATNIDVKGGGDYYMISRTLGVEFGGAIGLVLFLAQAVSIAFYAIGFGEAVANITGLGTDVGARLIATAAILVLFGLAWAGADIASKFQFVVMVVLVLALGSFYLGAIPGFEGSQASDNLSSFTGGAGFWVIFAIFFPAVTGFTQGVSLSGDLKDPGKSLPLGTFLAVAVSTVVYITIAILLAGNSPARTLIDDSSAMGSVAAWSPLIDAGVIAATLSSAMASFLGAPRILQSLATDRVFPRLGYFAKGHGPSSNPRRGVLLALLIAAITIALGDLNLIAPIVSMFFLISYGLLNYATFYEARAASPSFRPRFRFFDKRLSLLGALLCLATMMAINPVAGGAAAVVMFLIYRYLSTRDHQTRWADSARAHYFQRVREAIGALREEPDHPRSWRPQILAFSADQVRRRRLLRFATWFEGGSGLTGTVQIIVGSGAQKRREVEEAQAQLTAQIRSVGVAVHGRTILAPDAREAMPVIVQSFGFGPVRTNTVLFGWPEQPSPDRVAGFVQGVRDVARLGVNTVILSSGDEAWAALEGVAPSDRRIDVWIEPEGDSSRLALLAAYLFTRTSDWRRATIRAIGEPPADDEEAAVRSLQDRVDSARIPATVKVVPVVDTASILRESEGAAMVFLPMRLRLDGYMGPYESELDRLVGGLPMTASVLAAQSFDLNAAPESGAPAVLAAAEEQVARADQRLAALQRDLTDAEKRVEEHTRWAEATLTEEAMSARDQAAARVAELRRRVLSATARLERARSELAVVEGTGTADGPPA